MLSPRQKFAPACR